MLQLPRFIQTGFRPLTPTAFRPPLTRSAHWVTLSTTTYIVDMHSPGCGGRSTSGAKWLPLIDTGGIQPIDIMLRRFEMMNQDLTETPSGIAGQVPAARWRAAEAAGLFALTLFAPFVIHLLPVWGDESWGARLLPMFFGPLLAALFCRMEGGIAIALLAPWANFLLTGRPLPPMAVILSVQLMVFVLFLRWRFAGRGPRIHDPVLAYPVAVAASAVLIAIMPSLHPAGPVAHWVGSVATAWPGMSLLAIVTYLAVRFYRQPPATAQ